MVTLRAWIPKRMLLTIALLLGSGGSFLDSPTRSASTANAFEVSGISLLTTVRDRSHTLTKLNGIIPYPSKKAILLSQMPEENGDFPKGSRAGGSRGGCAVTPNAFQVLLFQKQEGQIISGQPTFFWYLSAPTPLPARFVLLDLQDSKILFEQVVEAPQAGFRQTTLPANLKLQPGRKYRWSVTLVCNPRRPSENLVAQGQIQLVPVPPDLAQQLVGVISNRQRAQVYAEHGFWYEALAEIGAAYNAQHQDSAIREEMLAILERMGQTWVVKQERQQPHPRFNGL